MGAIAAAGFVVGVAWPRIAGIRLGPSVPDATISTPSSTEVAPASPASPPGTQGASALPSAVGSATAAAPGAPATSSSGPSPIPAASDSIIEVVVGHGSVTRCETSDGDVLKSAQCGGLAGLDAIVMPRLRRLAKCKAISSASGVRLRFEVAVDFAHGSVAIDSGRARTSMLADSVLTCARSEMSGANITALEHEHPRYTVTYSVGLDGRRQPAVAAAVSAAIASPSSAPSSSPAPDAAAQVEWEVALVRDTPKTGRIVARLQRGTTVHVGSPKDGWYPVRYGDGYAAGGWVYRGAIGR